MAGETHIARVRMRGSLHGSETVNVLHFGSVGAVPPDNTAALGDILTDLLDCIRTTLLPGLSSDWSLRAVDATLIAPTLSDQIEVAAAGTDVGALGAGDVSFVAGLLSIRTGQGGRKKRGRMFLAGLPEGGIESSRLTPGELTLLAAFAACLVGKFITGVANPGWRLGVLSRVTQAANAGNAAAGFTAATSITTQQVVASMYSRKIGVGS